MAWKRRRLARTTEALRGTTPYMLGEPIIPTDGPFAGRLFLGDGVTIGGRALRFADDGIGIVAPLLKTANYTLVAGDAGRLVRCQGTLTLTLPAVAGLPPGWSVTLSNEGSGIVTLAPNGAEAIDGVAATLPFLPKQKATLISDGAGFRMIWQDREPLLSTIYVSSSVAFVDVAIPEAWPTLRIEWQDILTASSVGSAIIQGSLDGTSIVSGANSYAYSTMNSLGFASAAAGTNTTTGPYIIVGGPGFITAANGGEFRAHVLMDFTQGGPGKFGRIDSKSGWYDVNGYPFTCVGNGYMGPQGAWKKMRFASTGGNIGESAITIRGRAR